MPSIPRPKLTLQHADPNSADRFTTANDSLAPDQLQRLFQQDDSDSGEEPSTPALLTPGKEALTGTSPHRFLTSVRMFELDHRSRPNKFVNDEAGCVDMASDEAQAGETPARTPAVVPHQPSSLNQLNTGDSLAGIASSFGLEESSENLARNRASLDPIVRRLRGTQHFGILPRDDLEGVAAQLKIQTFARDEIVLNYGAVCTGCYVILRGRVAVLRPSRTVTSNFDSQWWLGRGECFGFDYVVVSSHTHRKFQVMTDEAILGFLDYHHLFRLIKKHPALAQSMARKMGEDMNAFQVFKEYARAVFAPTVSSDSNVVNWRNVLEKFNRINNGIYPEMHAPEIDTGAWTYALRRLPDNITQTFVIELSKAPPPMMASLMRKLSAEYDANPNGEGPRSADGRISYVGCKVRRRPSYLLPNGKTLILLRDSTTDLLDFTSCMCVHINESEKLRRRLINQVDPRLLSTLEEGLSITDADKAREILERLECFSDAELNGLINLWRGHAIKHIYDIVTTRREDMLVRIDLRAFRRFYRTPSTNFAANVRGELLRRLGLPDDGDLPLNLTIDVISSNAHSVKNLISPFPRVKRQQIMDFARQKCANDLKENWQNTDDLLYYVMSKYLDAHKDERHEFGRSWAKSGLTCIEVTSMTGLEVDIIDVSEIDAEHVDGQLRQAVMNAKQRGKSPYAAPHFIINMDFPFGNQAESIMKSLSVAFGHRIRSMNIMGKGGGIVGKRGDIQFPTHVLYSKSSVPYDDFNDELRPCGQQGITPEMMLELVGHTRDVHVGPVLTLAGTMCQNSKLLRYYKHLWGCIGMEMEGSYFARALEQGLHSQVLRPNLKTRFLYYTSDTPLASTEESLATGMRPTEGVPSVYAVMRAFMLAILNDDDQSVDAAETSPC